MSSHAIACHKCKHIWTYEPPLERRAECPQCRSDSRVCQNCSYFDRGAHHECREEQAEWVKEKDRGNFCSYFEGRGSATPFGGEVSNAKAKLDELFGGVQTPRSEKGKNFADDLANFLQGKK